jgi:hypothetical protein
MPKDVEKERYSVPEPSGVSFGKLRIEALPWGKARGLGQNGGYIAAYDAATDAELWVLKVYDVIYDGRKEDDKQDVFIEELTVDPQGRLLVTDERGHDYVVDILSRAVVDAK